MNENKVTSPCISVCKTDPVSGFCYGCGRTDEEKKLWKDENTSDAWKLENIDNLKNRLNGWQLEAFEASYISKNKTGLSLIKKNLLNSRKP